MTSHIRAKGLLRVLPLVLILVSQVEGQGDPMLSFADFAASRGLDPSPSTDAGALSPDPDLFLTNNEPFPPDAGALSLDIGVIPPEPIVPPAVTVEKPTRREFPLAGVIGPDVGQNPDSHLLDPAKAQSFLNSLIGESPVGADRKPNPQPENAVPVDQWSQLYPEGQRPDRIDAGLSRLDPAPEVVTLTDTEKQMAEIAATSFGAHRNLYQQLRMQRRLQRQQTEQNIEQIAPLTDQQTTPLPDQQKSPLLDLKPIQPTSVQQKSPLPEQQKSPLPDVQKLPLDEQPIQPAPVQTKLPLPDVQKLPIHEQPIQPAPVQTKLPLPDVQKLPLHEQPIQPAPVQPKIPLPDVQKLPLHEQPAPVQQKSLLPELLKLPILEQPTQPVPVQQNTPIPEQPMMRGQAGSSDASLKTPAANQPTLRPFVQWQPRKWRRGDD